jgi:hypothetical protein
MQDQEQLQDLAGGGARAHEPCGYTAVMISWLRQDFNQRFTPAKYLEFQQVMAERCGSPVKFRLCETPCFFPNALLDQMAVAGRELIFQLTHNPEYHKISEASIPDAFRVPNEPDHPMFVQVDFGLVRDASGVLQPKLVELQAFPSLYAYQPVLAQTYVDVFGLDSKLQYYLGGLDADSYRRVLADAILTGQDPEQVILMEIDPLEQKTLPDFLLTERSLGIPTVNITDVRKQGRGLVYEKNGRLIPIRRIYNRAIVDELERKHLNLQFRFTDDLDVEWAGHPNWFFRMSKFSIPYLRHATVPETRFLDQVVGVPSDLERYILKPLFSFAGLGVNIRPTAQDVMAIPEAERAQWILQERLEFVPVIETPHGATKAEVRIMYIWDRELLPVLVIMRLGRGAMMGVDHNKDMEWVGSSAALFLD